MMSGAQDIEIVGEASDGRSAVEVARRYHPDVALLDIKMRAPDDGIRALRAILALPDPPTVAMLTTFDIDEYVSLALRLGANGFLLKDIDPAPCSGPSGTWPRAELCSIQVSPHGWSSRIVTSSVPRNPRASCSLRCRSASVRL